MPDVLEPPTHRTLPPAARPFIFTQATASAAGKRSGAVRRAAELQRLLTQIPPQQRPPDLSVQQCINGQLELVEEQIALTRTVLNDVRTDYCEHCERGGIEPHHRAQLLKALDCLLDRQRKLLMIPEPGPQKPRQDRSLPTIDLQPMLSDAPAAPVKPMGWEYDEPVVQPDTTSGTPPN